LTVAGIHDNVVSVKYETQSKAAIKAEGYCMFKRSVLLILPIALLLGGCLFNINLAPGPQPLKETLIEGKGSAKILLVEISGFISSDEDDSVFGPSKPSIVSRIREELKKASDDKDVKGVVLKINTPGGGASASDAIHNELMRYREAAGVPVYASIVGMGTSGGYYAASAADRIHAQPTAVTGSIGVIAVSLEFSGLMEKLGVTDKTYRSGRMKGMISPFRPDSPEEKKIIQRIIDSMHKRFVDVVHEGRKGALTLEQVEALADGRPYTASAALEAGLIDSIGYPDDVIKALKEKLGLKEARIVAYHRPGSYRGSVYSHNNISGNTVLNVPGRAFGEGVRFLYLWTGN
jgi:protease-4